MFATVPSRGLLSDGTGASLDLRVLLLFVTLACSSSTVLKKPLSRAQLDGLRANLRGQELEIRTVVANDPKNAAFASWLEVNALPPPTGDRPLQITFVCGALVENGTLHGTTDEGAKLGIPLDHVESLHWQAHGRG